MEVFKYKNMRKYIKSSSEFEPVINGCPEERETTINVLGSSQTMEIYTSDNVMITKLKKLLDANPDTIKCWEAGRFEGKVTGYFFEMPKKHLSFRSSFNKHSMSEESRIAFGERIKKFYSERKSNNDKK